jgi:hypothetical protein
MQQKHLFTIEEVVIETGICRTNVYAQMKSGALKAVKIGRRTFVRPDDLRAFIASAPNYVPQSAA